MEQGIIVAAIVLAALVYMLFRLRRNAKGKGCGCGCEGGCACGGAQQQKTCCNNAPSELKMHDPKTCYAGEQKKP